jgi:hypothetical protein
MLKGYALAEPARATGPARAVTTNAGQQHSTRKLRPRALVGDPAVEAAGTLSRPNMLNIARKPATMAVAPYEKFQGPEWA